MDRSTFTSEIAEGLAAGNIVPFLGAGFSYYGGFPLWSDLLRNIIKVLEADSPAFPKQNSNNRLDLDKKLAEGDLQSVADYLGTLDPSVSRIIPRVLDNNRKKIRRHLPLAAWRCPLVITTNYDRYIEDLYTDAQTTAISLTYKEVPQLASQKPTDPTKPRILHLHGCVHHAAPLIFSHKQKRKEILRNEALWIWLEQLFVSKSFLFVGYGLRDPHMREFLDKLSDIFKKSDFRHFALINPDATEIDQQEYLQNLGLLTVCAGLDGESSQADALDEIHAKVGPLFSHKADDNATREREEKLIRDEKLEEYEKFRRLADIQNITMERKPLLELIVRKGLRIVGEDRKTFNIHLKQANRMVVVCEGGMNADKRSEIKVRELDSGLIGQVYKENLRYLHASDVSQWANYVKANPTTNSEVIIGLYDHADRFIGVLNIESTEVDDFSSEHIEIIKVVAAHVARALENARVYACLRSEYQSSQVLRPSYASGETMEATLKPLLEKIVQYLQFSTALLFRQRKRNDGARSILGVGDESVISSYQQVPVSVVERRMPAVTESVDEQGRVSVWQTVDLADDEDRLYVCFVSTEPRAIGEVERATIESTGNFIGAWCNFWNSSRLEFERLRELRLFQKVFAGVRGSSDLGIFLQGVADAVCKELDVNWCLIHIIDPLIAELQGKSDHQGALVLKAIAGEIERVELERRMYWPEDNALTAFVFRSAKVEESPNVYDDSRASKSNRRPFDVRGYKITTFLGAPISAKSDNSSEEVNVLGVVTVGRPRASDSDDRGFVGRDHEILGWVGSVVGMELERQLSRARLQSVTNYCELLLNAGEQFRQCGSTEDVFSTLKNLLVRYLGEQHFGVFHLEDGLLRMVAPLEFARRTPPVLKPPVFKVGEGLTGKVIEGEGKSKFSVDFSEGVPACKKFWQDLIGTNERYFIGVPIRLEGVKTFYGVLTVNGRRPREFDSELYRRATTTALEALAGQMGTALSRFQK